MERRLFLAIGLSVLVVWLYSFNAPKRTLSPQKSTQTIENKEDTIISEESAPSVVEPQPRFAQ
jgi:hypothetical protein